jgi:hypothetical protein
MWGVELEGSWVRPVGHKHKTPVRKIPKTKRAGGMAQGLECLHVQNTLSSNASTEKQTLDICLCSVQLFNKVYVSSPNWKPRTSSI